MSISIGAHHGSPFNECVGWATCPDCEANGDPMFIKLCTEDNTDIHVAVDEIASFRAYNRLHPDRFSIVTLKNGDVYRVIESVGKIGELIMEAR